MSQLLEEPVELERDDGVRVRGLRITPDFDDAEKCHGAGVVVAASAPTEEILAGLARPLARAGYFVVAVALDGIDDAGAEGGAGGAFADPVQDLQAAIRSVKDLARGRIGVIGLGAAATVALAAAAELPHVDAVVHVGGAVPARGVKLGRVRAAVLVHHAAGGTQLRDDELADLMARLKPSRAPLTIRRHEAAAVDVFAGAGEAWDQTTAFLALNLT